MGDKEMNDLKKTLDELNDLNDIESLITDNVIEFEHKKETYRVRQPSPKERREVNKKRMKEYTNLLQDDDYVTKEELKNQYRDKGIDIDGLENKLKQLESREKQLLKKIGKSDNDKKIEKLKEKLADVRIGQNDIVNKLDELLQYSIEELLNDFVETYFCYLLLEKQAHESGKEAEWKSAFDTYEDFMKCQDNKLITKTAYYLMRLIGPQNITKATE